MTIVALRKKENRYYCKKFLSVIAGSYREDYMIFQDGIRGVSEFTDFLFDKVYKVDFSLISKSSNTKRNYVYPLIKALNYFFYDSKNKINSIDDITVDLINEFLSAYAYSTLNGDISRYPRSQVAIARCKNIICLFVAWVWDKRLNGNRKKYKLIKNFKTDSFIEKEVETMRGRHKCIEIKGVLDYTGIGSRGGDLIKLKTIIPTNYLVNRLIEISEVFDPMLAFGIVLGAYAGIRTGTLVQLSQNRLYGFTNKYNGAYIKVDKDALFRIDSITGRIKNKKHTHDKVRISDRHIDIIRKYHKKHILLLRERGLHTHPSGALFFNRMNDSPLNDDMYRYRFNKLVALLNKFLLQEVLNREALIKQELENREYNDVVAEYKTDIILDYNILSGGKFTAHSLRYYFTNIQMGIHNGNVAKVQLDRNDRSPVSQKRYYLKSIPVVEGVKEDLNSLYNKTMGKRIVLKR